MADLLIEIYDCLLPKKLGDDHYQDALKQWSIAMKGKDDIELEDAAYAREYEFGYQAFLTGIQLARTLGYG